MTIFRMHVFTYYCGIIIYVHVSYAYMHDVCKTDESDRIETIFSRYLIIFHDCSCSVNIRFVDFQIINDTMVGGLASKNILIIWTSKIRYTN